MSLPVLIARLNLIALMIHVRLHNGPVGETKRPNGHRSHGIDGSLRTWVPACAGISASLRLAERCAAPVWWFERCAQNPIPSRTRPLNAPAPMVLCLKTRESRSPPDLHSTSQNLSIPSRRSELAPKAKHPGAGWSSPVARQAHNLKVTGSNPVPATKHQTTTKKPPILNGRGLSAVR